MVPSFVLAVFPYYIDVNSLELTSIISLFHEVTRAIALGLGVWFVAAWRFPRVLEDVLKGEDLWLSLL